MNNHEKPKFKKCSKCKQIKLTTEFYRNKSKKSGLESSCKACIKANVEMRKKDGILFKYVFIYWTLKSQLLEVFFKSPSKILRIGRKRRLQKEIGDIKEIILSGNAPEGELADKDLLRILLENR